MSISSLGVGSGLALDDLVKQLLEAERKPKSDRLNTREEKIEAEISGLGAIKSKLSEFKDAIKALREDKDINGREPTIKHPNEETEVFSADASSSASRGSYKIAVSELASGSRIETADAAFASTSDSVLSAGSGSLTFKVGSTGDTFSVNVTAGMTLSELRTAINDNADNFGVSANIIDTGTAAGGAKLVFTSEVTGAGNDLQVVNDNNLAELDRVSTTDSSETATYLTPVKAATNAKATIDGIAVESETNKFDNTIANVSFTAKDVSPMAADGVTPVASTLEIGFDKEGLEEKIRSLVENYNGVISEIKKLTKYGASELEDDGVLAGDSLIRGMQGGLGSIMSSNVSASALGGLFTIGVELNKDGELEIGTTNYGLGTGEDRLEDALEDNFDEIAKLFTDENEGIAVRLYDYIEQYTSSSGLISTREKAAKQDQDRVYDDRERLEVRMISYEQMLRDRYLGLDQTIAKMNQTGSALFAMLG
ncbi:flagellar filament capping protein FliD [Alteromonas ponticola]|uniref:Flagellar hook-associated protein 2 n=1 Tax=Alteromonas ponticola TaxID=2720613 RepID=A0ABX1R0R0_9ALTE|nr:flagellar filament capping protein FliD [Alteromonas ponticola]NMH59664.1 flagellar filament capping protein FliD [Alteromonas ponticola]